LALKTAGDIRQRARAAAPRLAPVVVLLAAGFLMVSQIPPARFAAGQP
jgi:hypothetical protein